MRRRADGADRLVVVHAHRPEQADGAERAGGKPVRGPDERERRETPGRRARGPRARTGAAGRAPGAAARAGARCSSARAARQIRARTPRAPRQARPRRPRRAGPRERSVKAGRSIGGTALARVRPDRRRCRSSASPSCEAGDALVEVLGRPIREARIDRLGSKVTSACDTSRRGDHDDDDHAGAGAAGPRRGVTVAVSSGGAETRASSGSAARARRSWPGGRPRPRCARRSGRGKRRGPRLEDRAVHRRMSGSRVGRHPSRGCVRMCQEADGFELRQLIADGRG